MIRAIEAAISLQRQRVDSRVDIQFGAAARNDDAIGVTTIAVIRDYLRRPVERSIVRGAIFRGGAVVGYIYLRRWNGATEQHRCDQQDRDGTWQTLPWSLGASHCRFFP